MRFVLAGLAACILLSACRDEQHAGTYREPIGLDIGMTIEPPPGWARSEADGLVWTSVPPPADPLSGRTRLTLTVVGMPERVGRPSGKLQVAHLVEQRNLTLPGGSFEAIAHRTAKFGQFEGLELESKLAGAGGSRRMRQACFWEGGRQYTLTLTAADEDYDAASAIFRRVAEAARYEDSAHE